jgi:hypothetical protein
MRSTITVGLKVFAIGRPDMPDLRGPDRPAERPKMGLHPSATRSMILAAGGPQGAGLHGLAFGLFWEE